MCALGVQLATDTVYVFYLLAIIFEHLPDGYLENALKCNFNYEVSSDVGWDPEFQLLRHPSDSRYVPLSSPHVCCTAPVRDITQMNRVSVASALRRPTCRKIREIKGHNLDV